MTLFASLFPPPNDGFKEIAPGLGRGSASAPDLRATSTGFAERKPPINSAELNACRRGRGDAVVGSFYPVVRFV